MKTYTLWVSWIISPKLSNIWERDALIKKAVRRDNVGSGYCFDDNRRDMSFQFKTKKGAENAMKRVRQLRKRVKCQIL
jgi:hypothetical protein